jgi:hypothetical protein
MASTGDRSGAGTYNDVAVIDTCEAADIVTGSIDIERF